MQPLVPEASQKEVSLIERITKNCNPTEDRIGMYFRKLSSNQKARFNRIVNSILRKTNITYARNPMEAILVRQIALNTVRIEQGELDILNGKVEAYTSDAEKWLLLAQRERRDAMKDLVLLMKTGDKKGSINKFSDIRDSLRGEDGLGKSTEPDQNPDGHDRRSYDDDIIRTVK